MVSWDVMLMLGLCVLSLCQIIIGEDGTCGANGSHATADGTVCMGMGDHTVAFM